MMDDRDLQSAAPKRERKLFERLDHPVPETRIVKDGVIRNGNQHSVVKVSVARLNWLHGERAAGAPNDDRAHLIAALKGRRMRLITKRIYCAFDGTQFDEAEACKAYEVENFEKQFIGLSANQVAAAMVRDGYAGRALADAFERMGRACALKRLEQGERRRPLIKESEN